MAGSALGRRVDDEHLERLLADAGDGVICVLREVAHVSGAKHLYLPRNLHPGAALQDVVGLLDVCMAMRQRTAAFATLVSHDSENHLQVLGPYGVRRNQSLVDGAAVVLRRETLDVAPANKVLVC